MELKRGLLVRSKAGHDKHGFFVVLSADQEFAVICDGKHRPLQRPKKKNCRQWEIPLQMHSFMAVTNTVLPEEAMKTNREIRRGIRCYLEKDPQS